VPAEVQDERPLTLATRNWWVDHVRRLTTTGALTFTDLNTGNFSIERHAFASSGGFRRMPRREDWEFSYRIQRSGIDIVAAPSAAIEHPTDHDVRNMLRDRMDEGAGDYVFAEMHPEAAHVLPLWNWVTLGNRMKTVLSGIFLCPEVGVRTLQPMTAAVVALNRVSARRTLARHASKAFGVAYFTGVARSAGTEARFLETLSRSPAWGLSGDSPVQQYELSVTSWDAPDPEAVTLDLTWQGQRLAAVPSRMGGFPWSAEAFGHRLAALPPHVLSGERFVGAGS
jgi:hypothetical protein